MSLVKVTSPPTGDCASVTTPTTCAAAASALEHARTCVRRALAIPASSDVLVYTPGPAGSPRVLWRFCQIGRATRQGLTHRDRRSRRYCRCVRWPREDSARIAGRRLRRPVPRYRFSEFIVSPRQRLLLRNNQEQPLIPRYF